MKFKVQTNKEQLKKDESILIGINEESANKLNQIKLIEEEINELKLKMDSLNLEYISTECNEEKKVKLKIIKENNEYYDHHLYHSDDDEEGNKYNNNELSNKRIENNLNDSKRYLNYDSPKNQNKFQYNAPIETEKDTNTIIFEEINKFLYRINDKIEEYKPINIEEEKDKDPLTKRICSVAFIDSTKENNCVYFQTFTILSTTTIIKVLESATKFWELLHGLLNESDFDAYSIYQINRDNVYPIKDIKVGVEDFSKTLDNVKDFRYVFHKKTDEMDELKIQKILKLIQVEDVKNESIEKPIFKESEKFFKIFTGNTEFIRNRYMEIKEEELTKDKDTVIDNSISIVKIVYFMFFPVLFILFLVFTLVSLSIMSPQDNSFYRNLSMKSFINAKLKNEKDFYTIDEAIEEIKDLFSPFVYSPITINRDVRTETIKVISPLKLSFVSVIINLSFQ